MEKLKFYFEPFTKIWSGRVDDPEDPKSFRWHQIVESLNLEDSNFKGFPAEKKVFGILGFCSDKGVKKNLGRLGASKAPSFIRSELANLPFNFDSNILIVDVGDIVLKDNKLEEAQIELATLVKRMRFLNIFPIILGGGHELAFGHYMGLSENFSQEVGIINFDAHFDLRPYKGGSSSGSMFLQIADQCRLNKQPFNYFCAGIQTYGNTGSLFEKAKELNVKYYLAKDINSISNDCLKGKLDVFLKDCKEVYLTLCADVFSSAFAPGVSAPQPFGMDPERVLDLIKYILSSGKIIGFDIAEVSPRFDEDNRTAKLAAIIIFAAVNKLVN